MNYDISQLKKDIQKLGNLEKAKSASKFFKIGKGEYGEGDIFLGVAVPHQRKIAKKYRDLPIQEVQKLLQSKIHEHRLTALFILVEKYQHIAKTPVGAQNSVSLRVNNAKKKEIVEIYLKNAKQVNNWDLVDSSAHYILGDWLLNHSRQVLYRLAKSKNIWKRRIAIISTFAFIKHNEFTDTLNISYLLLQDKHDLIHKAVGWMLREVGKRNVSTEEKFLQKHYKKMPRTMLRYAIEKFPEPKRKMYLKK